MGREINNRVDRCGGLRTDEITMVGDITSTPAKSAAQRDALFDVRRDQTGFDPVVGRLRR